jgi:hypothetical protein
MPHEGTATRHRRRIPALRLSDKQMHMLRRHHVADELKTVFLSYLVENAHEYVARSRGTEQRKPTKTTKSPTLTDRAWGTLNR